MNCASFKKVTNVVEQNFFTWNDLVLAAKSSKESTLHLFWQILRFLRNISTGIFYFLWPTLLSELIQINCASCERMTNIVEKSFLTWIDYYYYYYYYFYSFTRKRFYWVTFKLKDIHRAKFCTATCFICHYTDFGNGECQPRIGLFTPFKFGNADYNIYFLDWKFQTLNGLIGYFLLFTTLHLTIKYFYGGLI